MGVFLILTTIALAGCQESSPSRTIVSMQIDSDGDDTWIYVYTIPRVKMDNLTISFNQDSETSTSVFSHQRLISKEVMSDITDSTGYFTLSVAADLSEVYWEYSCRIKIIPDSEFEENQVQAEVILTEDIEEEPEIWELPYNVPLDIIVEEPPVGKDVKSESQDVTKYTSMWILVLLAAGGAGYYFFSQRASEEVQGMNLSKTPFAYRATIVLVVAFLLYLLFFQMGWIHFDASDLLAFYSFSVFTVSLAAVLGGVLVGMFIATRSLSNQGFTPFEISMLKLRDDIHKLQKEINSVAKTIDNDKKDDENGE
ncbi:MAG: hypothetical protein NZ820_15240 [Dehalococcoidia bacterium]|nr:hypothetical protein [Dehalococcoidia bacterium]